MQNQPINYTNQYNKAEARILRQILAFLAYIFDLWEKKPKYLHNDPRENFGQPHCKRENNGPYERKNAAPVTSRVCQTILIADPPELLLNPFTEKQSFSEDYTTSKFDLIWTSSTFPRTKC